MGYRSDFEGAIDITCISATAAQALVEVLDARHDTCWFVSDTIATDNVVTISVSLFEKWYDCESDLRSLVDWLHTQAIVRDVSGEIRVSGEETDDLWCVRIRDGSVIKLYGHVTYEDDDETTERAEDVICDIVSSLLGTDSPHYPEIVSETQKQFAERVHNAR